MYTDTRVTDIAAGIYQLTTVIPEAPVAFNQYLIAATEPLLFHTGMWGLFPSGIRGEVHTPGPDQRHVLTDLTG